MVLLALFDFVVGRLEDGAELGLSQLAKKMKHQIVPLRATMVRQGLNILQFLNMANMFRILCRVCKCPKVALWGDRRDSCLLPAGPGRLLPFLTCGKLPMIISMVAVSIFILFRVELFIKVHRVKHQHLLKNSLHGILIERVAEF
jgi:hypothetical protein